MKKRCVKCGKVKTVESFYIRDKKTGLRRTECKECIYESHNIYYQKNKSSILLKVKNNYYKNWDRRQQTRNTWIENNLDKYKKYVKKYHSTEKYKNRARAYKTVYNAIKSGKIKKPLICEKCNKFNTKIEGHHYQGYDVKNRLKLMWLCLECHKKEHL